MAKRARTAVVHLVWGPAGLAPFETFMSSYERHDAGFEHDLVLLYNGVTEMHPYRSRARYLGAREIVLAQPRLDLAAYVAAARRLEHERLCFANSYSQVLVPGWLRLLDAALEDPAAGAAGATGSWASPLSYSLYQLGLRTPYAQAFPSRHAAREAFRELFGGKKRGAASYWLYTALRTARHGRATGSFPAPHLRTNAFLIDRELWLTVTNAPTKTKWDTYRLESGARSITARLCAAGTPPVVVDARGVSRGPEDWHRGNVLFQGRQEDLVMADNVTRRYASATSAQRDVLSAFAWGRKARPRG